MTDTITEDLASGFWAYETAGGDIYFGELIEDFGDSFLIRVLCKNGNTLEDKNRYELVTRKIK